MLTDEFRYIVNKKGKIEVAPVRHPLIQWTQSPDLCQQDCT